MPGHIRYIIGNEGCERFSFYGMRAILVEFMTASVVATQVGSVPGLGFEAANAKAIFHTFVMSLYAFTLIGGYIADRFWGRYKTILYLSLVYCAGHAALAIWEDTFGLYLGLTLIALGSGGIKPCVSAFVGDQFDDSNRSLVKTVYGLFYWIINFGSFFSTLLTPYLRAHYGNSVAFAVPGILMALATVIFWLGNKQYTHVPPAKSPSSFAVILYAAVHQKNRKAGQSFLDVARGRYDTELVDGVRQALRVASLFLPITMFWSLFDQKASYWVLQARQMDLTVHLGFTDITLQASQVGALNPALIMMLIPLFTLVIYPWLDRMGISVTPLRRMMLGMFLAGTPFVVVGLIQLALDDGQRLNIAWQFIAYLLLTVSEILVSTTGLEFAYTQAPRKMKSMIMALWSVSTALGNGVTAIVAKANVFTTATSFFFFAALMLVAAGFFFILARRFQAQEAR